MVVPPAKVLIIEDDEGIREALRLTLEFEGYEVQVASNGRQGLQRLWGSAHPCLILLDLMMPVMDGWTFRRELAKNAALADIPVVVMTAASAARAAAIPSAAVLHKPLEIEAVIEVVQEHCPGGAA